MRSRSSRRSPGTRSLSAAACSRTLYASTGSTCTSSPATMSGKATWNCSRRSIRCVRISPGYRGAPCSPRRWCDWRTRWRTRTTIRDFPWRWAGGKMLGVPLLSKGVPVGVITSGGAKPGRFKSVRKSCSKSLPTRRRLPACSRQSRDARASSRRRSLTRRRRPRSCRSSTARRRKPSQYSTQSWRQGAIYSLRRP
jgi:hypothetical protein